MALAERYAASYVDFGYNFDTNGERRVMDVIAPFGVRVVFDVGANVGDWTRTASTFFKGAQFHCFELSPTTFSRLQDTLVGEQFVLNNLGMGDRTGDITFKDYGPAHSTANTITSTAYHDDRLAFEMCRSRLVTGDSYMADSGVDRIDFLKIDVEGAEHMVLKGFEQALKRGTIRIIQFEYGYANGDAKFLMRDFYELLEGHGYRVGKIWSDGVDFKPFEYRMNNFDSGPNYLAVSGVEGGLLGALALRR